MTATVRGALVALCATVAVANAATVQFQYGLNGNNTARFIQIRDNSNPGLKNLPGAVLVADG